MLKREDFGKKFKWGVTLSAFQNEGAAFRDGKGPSVWDTFTAEKSNVKNDDVIGEASAVFFTFWGCSQKVKARPARGQKRLI